MPRKYTTGFTIEVDARGFRDTNGRFVKASREVLTKHILPVSHEVRDLVIGKMKEEAPVKTGALRDSISYAL